MILYTYIVTLQLASCQEKLSFKNQSDCARTVCTGLWLGKNLNPTLTTPAFSSLNFLHQARIDQQDNPVFRLHRTHR